MVATLTPPTNMKACISIAKWFPRGLDGEYLSVNKVYESIRQTPNEVGRNTLRLALDGVYSKGEFENQVKLARLCSEWSGKLVTVDDLMVVED